ncbi:MAG: hypothetical protein ACK4TF_00540 [Thermodesulfovibrionales bacterium]
MFKRGTPLMVIILTLVLCPSLYAEEIKLYVQSIKASILSEPLMGAKELVKVERGEVLYGVEKKDRWYRVRYKDISGWVSAFVVDTKPPSKRLSIIETSEEELQHGARKRASAFVTAAAARGLMEERARLSDRYRIDPESLRWLEAIHVSDEEAIKFLEEGMKR